METADQVNPLTSESPRAWDELMESIGPASILVVIETRMSTALKRRMTPEDIWQEAMLHAWRDRRLCQWCGVRSFRAWLLTIIDNRIREAADSAGAQKRGGGRPEVPFSSLRKPDSNDADDFGPVGSTTPSRIAIFREQAAAMHDALFGLPDDLREIVRLRLFEQCELNEIAERLALGESAVRHRFRKGAELYQERLRAALARRATSIPSGAATVAPGISSPEA